MKKIFSKKLRIIKKIEDLFFSCYSALQETTERISENRIFQKLDLRKAFGICEKNKASWSWVLER